MSDTSEKSPKVSSATTKPDAGADTVQQEFDKANEQGFFGTEVDKTPNENYTLQGVASGAPTPETDADAREKAKLAADEAGKAGTV